MRASSSLQNDRVEVCPCFDVLEIIGLGDCEVLRELHLVSFVVEREETLWNEGGGVENTRERCSQQVALLAAKGRVGIDIGVQVAGEDVLDQASLLNVLGAAIRKLDPVLEQVGRYPEDSFVDALTASLHGRILRFFLCIGQATRSNPVVGLRAVDLSAEADGVGPGHDGQALGEKMSIRWFK